MLKIAVCDDERAVREEVSGLLCCRNAEYCVTIFENGAELLTSAHEFDVVILDIEMPELDGMTAAVQLRRTFKDTYIVFLTNHDEVMRDAFKVRAFRFFSKPLNPGVLYSTLAEIEREIQSTVKLQIVSKGAQLMIRLSDITYLEAYGDGTYIFTADSFYDTRQQLVYWNKLLKDRGFVQVNRNHVIAVDKITGYNSRSVTVNGIEFGVSRFKLSEFRTAVERQKTVT